MQYTTKTIKMDNFTVTINRPILSEVERKKREQEVIRALVSFEKAKERKNEQTDV